MYTNISMIYSKLKREITLSKMVSSLVLQDCFFVCFNATFNNISDISLRSVLLSGGNRRTRRKPLICRIMLYTSPWSIFELTTSVVIGTDCIGSLKSNYHPITITTTTAPVCSYSSRNKNIKYSLKFFCYFNMGMVIIHKSIHLPNPKHNILLYFIIFILLWNFYCQIISEIFQEQTKSGQMIILVAQNVV